MNMSTATQTQTHSTVDLNAKDIDLRVLAFLNAKRDGLTAKLEDLMIRRITNVTDLVNARDAGRISEMRELEREADSISETMMDIKRNRNELDRSINDVKTRLSGCAND